MSRQQNSSAPAELGPDGTAGGSQSAAAPLDNALTKDIFVVAGVVVLGALMSILDVTVVSVALPTFQADFGVGPNLAAWSMTGYTLALATVIPLTGWAANRFGTKRLYLLALALFVLGSLLCATAGDMTWLIVYRVLQGFGGGMLMPLGMTIVTQAAGAHRVGRVMAILGIPMLLGPICGPILGGWLIEIASWHWIFLINLPIGIIALVYAYLALPSDSSGAADPFDIVGVLLISPGLALFLFGVSSIVESDSGVSSPRVWIPCVVGLILMGLFIYRSLRTAYPLLNLKLFKDRNLSVSVIAMALFMVAFMGASLLFPSYFIAVRAETALQAGLLLVPQGLGAMLTMPIAGTIADRRGPGLVVPFGLALTVVGFAGFATVDHQTSYALLMGLLFVMGLGMGCTMMPIMTGALATLSHREIPGGSTILNMVQQAAGSVGTAVMSLVLTNRQESSASLAELQAMPSSDPTAEGGQAPDFSALISNPNLPEPVRLLISQAWEDLGRSFGTTFLIATALLALAFIPAFFLPRKKTEGASAVVAMPH